MGNVHYPYYRDVITDDDLARMVHAMNAPSREVFHWQVCEDPFCSCYGPGWSSKILAEVWHETLPAHEAEIAPRAGDVDPEARGFVNGLDVTTRRR